MQHDPYAGYIAAAYGFCLAVIGWLVVSTFISARRVRRELEK